MAKTRQSASMQIFRATDGQTLAEEGCMTVEPFTPAQSAAFAQMYAEGYGDGGEVRVLVNIPGFSLTHIWFKRDFPLPLHSHDVDCLYHIIAGGLRLGTEELGARDSFFVPRDVPYTYRTGPEGVELVEIRHANSFNFVNRVKGDAYWAKAIATCTNRRDEWKSARRPIRTV